LNNIVVEGKGGIRVEVVLHSISEAGKEIITFLVDHPRIVHAEELKHRQFSYSAASSRAIPAAKMAEQLTGMPVSFGKNQSGMQAGGEHSGPVKMHYPLGLGFHFDPDDIGEPEIRNLTPAEAWQMAKDDAVKWSNAFARSGYHKQVYNRLTEPFQMIRVLVSATETANFFWLRNDKAADPTLQEQAKCMWEAKQQSVPQLLKAGEWHLPFVDSARDQQGKQFFYLPEHEDNPTKITLDHAIKISCARCAATSFRNENYDLAKSLQVYDRLVNGDKVHAGALEHCATPIEEKYANVGMDNFFTKSDSVNVPYCTNTWQQGISHMDRQGQLWSGNFCGWIQYRKLVPNECYKGNQ
jgi:hypothetical protein